LLVAAVGQGLLLLVEHLHHLVRLGCFLHFSAHITEAVVVGQTPLGLEAQEVLVVAVLAQVLVQIHQMESQEQLILVVAVVELDFLIQVPQLQAVLAAQVLSSSAGRKINTKRFNSCQ
jgi:hypothetical protein